tara:strand:+ start:148 stop:735 length:588 start_codon:yes stop_codon:yes gene_type:complete
MKISNILLSIIVIDYYSQKKNTFITTASQNVSFFLYRYLTILVRFIYTPVKWGFMKLTSKGRYAVMALVDLARFNNINPVSLRDISLRQGISLDYLEQIFSKLRKKEIVQSVRGTQGGYVLNKKAKEIKLTNIFDAVDEKVKTVQCKKDSKKGCNGKSTKCLTHNLWDELENHINNFFDEKSLEDLVKDNSERRF